MTIRKQPDIDKNASFPEYLRRWPGLYMRQGGRIVNALPEDIEVARGYPGTMSNGAAEGGRRITIMCRARSYRLGEQVRMIHVMEVLEAGQEIFIVGPKAIIGEHVDGHEMTPEVSGEQNLYDGPVLNGPGVDYNYDITT